MGKISHQPLLASIKLSLSHLKSESVNVLKLTTFQKVYL